jgi:hypothetical protein
MKIDEYEPPDDLNNLMKAGDNFGKWMKEQIDEKKKMMESD